jgi:hypothetical protein
MLEKISTPRIPSSVVSRWYSAIISSSTTGSTPTAMNRSGQAAAISAMASLATRVNWWMTGRGMPSHIGGRTRTRTCWSTPIRSM